MGESLAAVLRNMSIITDEELATLNEGLNAYESKQYELLSVFIEEIEYIVDTIS